MRRHEPNSSLLAAAMITMMILPAASAATSSLLSSGLGGASGSAIGPGGALYVTEGTRQAFEGGSEHRSGHDRGQRVADRDYPDRRPNGCRFHREYCICVAGAGWVGSRR